MADASTGPITRPLLAAILEQAALPPDGPHGVVHWARVLENGRRLVRGTHAISPVVELFAVFHDACRESDGSDPDHGRRGARLAERWRGTLFELGDEEFDLLCRACEEHTGGGTEADVTVQACWDADRLDLGRVGIRPVPHLLCTPAARSRTMIEWAHARAVRSVVPQLMRAEWGLDPRGRFPR